MKIIRLILLAALCAPLLACQTSPLDEGDALHAHDVRGAWLADLTIVPIDAEAEARSGYELSLVIGEAAAPRTLEAVLLPASDETEPDPGLQVLIDALIVAPDDVRTGLGRAVDAELPRLDPALQRVARALMVRADVEVSAPAPGDDRQPKGGWGYSWPMNCWNACPSQSVMMERFRTAAESHCSVGGGAWATYSMRSQFCNAENVCESATVRTFCDGDGVRDALAAQQLWSSGRTATAGYTAGGHAYSGGFVHSGSYIGYSGCSARIANGFGCDFALMSHRFNVSTIDMDRYYSARARDGIFYDVMNWSAYSAQYTTQQYLLF